VDQGQSLFQIFRRNEVLDQFSNRSPRVGRLIDGIRVRNERINGFCNRFVGFGRFLGRVLFGTLGISTGSSASSAPGEGFAGINVSAGFVVALEFDSLSGIAWFSSLCVLAVGCKAYGGAVSSCFAL
jgi:hypothetical protein